MGLQKRSVFPIATLIGLALVIVGSFIYWGIPPGGSKEGHTVPSGEVPVKLSPLLVAGEDAGYVDRKVCDLCHSQIAETYAKTGMGRSFSRLRAQTEIENWGLNNVYYHPASDRYYTMYKRGDKYYQRRHQRTPDGREIHVVEKEIHYVLGSGNRARAYLHKTPDGRLFELPLGWYSDKDGFFAMNPGYDRPDHFAFSRRITHPCMFCHNGYPEIVPGSDGFGQESLFPGEIPEGIDCQRCHGPGRDHIQTLRKQGATLEEVRGTILNPARLSPERQLQLCEQCHLETTSARLPANLRRYDRGVYSYRPWEPLENYIFHFDHLPGTSHADKFEIVNQAYRLRQSACFKKSNGALNCLSCHDPHHIHRGEEAVEHYVSVCQSCHGKGMQKLIASGRHTRATDCLECHMPKRRTDDVVHVIMTDHSIQRFKPDRDLLAPLSEDRFYSHPYHGEVMLYFPSPHPRPEDELYVAVAQVRDDANLQAGIPRLERAIQRLRPAQAGFYYELAEAFQKAGQPEKAIRAYEQALKREPDLWLALRGLGRALAQTRDLKRAQEILERASRMKTEKAAALNDLALVYRDQVKLQLAVETFKRALREDPELTEAHNNLGSTLLEAGDFSGAEAAFLEAVRIQPDIAGAQHSLAKVLAARGIFGEAQYHFEKALERNPDQAQIHLDYGLALTQVQRYDRAEVHLKRAVRLQPDWGEAHLNLGTVLALEGKTAESLNSLRRAAGSSDPSVRQEAMQLIQRIEQ